ncbi:biotin/lipoyl-binding protein [Naumannella sp. ID2617S]|uniref:Acetyl-CoA carboxylase biotin carboxyl carrier protein subunit n=1 Tax=Enemella dayhoffiae TaxID=2016507 RepID=A0A255H9V7_9ACTN|nr:biotin/lipoyl-containing protein [Enemella dayhoffiae]NNG21232.1 biotin/lipoyl-binding protein [Naumannella sp. ID2617S]OYO24421.1 acetyl-CoA carboxylase biotin carboxyl carrier protein subunit [Enemella dayhoffiae]
MKLKVTVNGTPYEVEVEVAEEERPSLGSLVIGGAQGTPTAPTSASVPAVSANSVVAPLAGSIARILVEEGDSIESGQVLVVLEAMKMETEITAPQTGTVAAVHVAPGDPVQGGQVLIDLAS